MTETECRTYLSMLTLEQRKELDTRTGYGMKPDDVEQMVGVIRRIPELERPVVFFLNEKLGCRLMTEADRAQQATIAGPKRDWVAIGVAVIALIVSAIALFK